ncbi:S8 family serine peptidase [Candidatus Woesearchaeota archaeon]|nr:S8 family serine peptidase [Candidatus Woesearchaeota archaeon]
MRKRQIRKHKRGKPAARPIYKEGFFWIAFAVLVLTLAAFAAFQVLNKPFAGKAHGILTEQGAVPELPGEEEPAQAAAGYELKEEMSALGYEIAGDIGALDGFSMLRGDNQVIFRKNDSFFVIQNLSNDFVLSINGKQAKFAKVQEAEKPEATHIVEFKREPLAAFYTERRANGVIGLSESRAAAQEYALGLAAEREDAVLQLAEINPGLPSKIRTTYTKTFNGVAIKATEEEVPKIRNLSSVKAVYENSQVWALLSESVPQINADRVWELTDGQGRKVKGEGVTIAVIDTGVDYTHADLGGCLGESCKVVGGYDFVNNDNDPADDNGHGTHVAATAAGDGALKGAAPKASIIAYKVLNAQGGGYTSEIIDAIEMAVDPNQDGDFSDRADIISMSLGGQPQPNDPLATAVNHAVEVGTVAVIAAGNSGSFGNETIGSPGTAEKAITVGAVNKTDNLAEFSSRGPVVRDALQFIKPDVVAPGVMICAAKLPSADYPPCLDDSHGAISGTSMATPHVSGVAALLLQAHPDWTPEDVKSALMSTSADLGLHNYDQGAGRIDAEKANSAEISIEPASFSLDLKKSESATVKIKNLANRAITADMRMEFPEGPENPVATVNPEQITLQPGEEADVELAFESQSSGVIFGELTISTGRAYRVPFLLSRVATLTIQADEGLSPYFAISSNDSLIRQVTWTTMGVSNYTFVIPPGEYTAYALTSIYDGTRYALYDTVKLGLTNSVLNLSLKDAKKLNVQTTTARGHEILLTGDLDGVVEHGDRPFNILSACFGCPPFLNPLYASIKPEEGPDIDIVMQFKGVECMGTASGACDASRAPMSSENYYLIGWIIPNVRDNQPDLTFPESELANYTYEYNYPGGKPLAFNSVVHFHQPIPDVGWFSMSIVWPLASPLNRTYHAWSTNPDRRTYPGPYFFSNSHEINYKGAEGGVEQWIVDFLTRELYGMPPYDYLPVRPGAETVTVGTAPYTPASVISKDGAIMLDGRLIRGNNGKAWVQRQLTYAQDIRQFPDPTYQILFNEQNLSQRALTRESYGGYVWDEQQLSYQMDEAGTYHAAVVIPLYYSVWKDVLVDAWIKHPGTDESPPIMRKLNAGPRIEQGNPYMVSAEVTDDTQVASVSIEYRPYGGLATEEWIRMEEELLNGKYAATIAETSSIESLDLRITATDSSGNRQMYTIIPAALKGREIRLSVAADKDTAGRQVRVSFNGECTLDECQEAGLRYYLNGKFVKPDIALKPYWQKNAKPKFSYTYEVPADHTDDFLNFTVVYPGTGIYAPTQASAVLPVNIRENDLAVRMMADSAPNAQESTQVNITVTNTGRSRSSESTIVAYRDGRQAYNGQIKALSPQESERVVFNWTPSKREHNLTAVLSYPNDEFTGNNRQELAILPVGPDLFVWPTWAPKPEVYIGDSLGITFSAQNFGIYTSHNVTIGLSMLQDINWLGLPLNRSNRLRIGEKDYVMSMAVIGDTLEVNITEGTSTINAVMTPGIPYMEAFGKMLIVSELEGGSLPTKRATVFFGNHETIRVNRSFVDPYQEITGQKMWKPHKPGEYGIMTFGNASRELDYVGNAQISGPIAVLERTPDLEVSLNAAHEVRVLSTTEITVVIANKGTGPSARPVIEVYDSPPSGKQLIIGTREIPELVNGSSAELKYNWTPQAAGPHIIQASAVDDNDPIQWNNQESEYVAVLNEGPDIILDRDPEIGGETRVGERLELKPKVINTGTGPAEVNISLYVTRTAKVREFGDYKKSYNSKRLVSTLDLGTIAPGEEKTPLLEYIVEGGGGIILFVEINASGDAEAANNKDSYYLKGLWEGVDIMAEFQEVPAFAVKGQRHYMSAYISSFGTKKPALVNVTISAGSLVLLNRSFEIENDRWISAHWTPDSTGNTTLKVQATALEEAYPSNDVEEVIVPVVGSRKLMLRSSAPEGVSTAAWIEGDYAQVPPEGAEFDIPDAPAYVQIYNSWSGSGGSGGSQPAEPASESLGTLRERYMAFTTERSQLAAEELVQSDLLFNQQNAGWLKPYATMVSKVSWQYESADSYFSASRADVNGTGEDLANSELYICEKWEGTCSSDWKQGNLTSLWLSASGVSVYSSHTKAQAFMLAIKDYDLDGKPDYRDEDDDGDGKNDNVDSVKCRGSEQGFDSDVREPAASPTTLAEPNSRLSRKGKPLAEFATGLNDRIDCSEIKVKLQDEASSIGYTIISGLNISQPKAVFVEKKSGASKVCIKDAEVGSISEVTPACSGADEYHLTCNGSYNSGYSCTDTGTSYKITGLRHSAVVEDAACVESWSCTEWGACISGQQTRTCTDANSCGTARGKPAESQSCGSAGASWGGGGSTYTSNPDTPSLTSRYDIQLERQSTLQLYKGDRASFSFKGNDYSLAAGFILPKQMSLIKSGGKRVEIKIGVGSSAEMDLDDDGWTDISAAYTSYSGGRATVTIGPKQLQQPPATTPPTLPRPTLEPEQDYIGAPTPPDATAPYTPPYQLPTEDFPEDEPDEPSTIRWIEDYTNYLIIAVGAALLILLGIGVYVLLSRKTGHSGTSLLANSIRQNLRQGFTEQQIRGQMKKVGWSDSQIDRAFREARK